MKSIKKLTTLVNAVAVIATVRDTNNAIKSVRDARAKTEQMKASSRTRMAASDAALARSLRNHKREIEEIERQARLRMEEQNRIHNEAMRRAEELAREHDRQFNDMMQQVHQHHHFM